jgi:hypothetical protein
MAHIAGAYNAMQRKRGSAASSASGQRGLLNVQPKLSWLLLADRSRQVHSAKQEGKNHGTFSLQSAEG